MENACPKAPAASGEALLNLVAQVVEGLLVVAEARSPAHLRRPSLELSLEI